MAADEEYCAYLVDQLAGFGPVSTARFFGGRSFKRDGLQFAMVIGDTFYFCVDDLTRPDYEARDMPHFSYQKGGRTVAVRKYHEVPAEVVDDADDLCEWAEAAYAAALRARK